MRQRIDAIDQSLKSLPIFAVNAHDPLRKVVAAMPRCLSQHPRFAASRRILLSQHFFLFTNRRPRFAFATTGPTPVICSTRIA